MSDEYGSNQLPSELLINEIFLKLSIKSLLTCKCVCRQWNCIISSPEFVRIHLNQTNLSNENCLLINTKKHFLSFDMTIHNVHDDHPYTRRGSRGNYIDYIPPKTLVQAPEANKFHFHAQHPSVQAVASCDGLVCLNVEGDSLYVWNPSTLQRCQIPRPQRPGWGEASWGLGRAASTQEYKLVRITNVERNKVVQVFSFNQNNWKEIDGHFERYSNRMLRIIGHGVSVNDIMYWSMCSKIDYGGFIIGFNLVTEELEPLPLPEWSYKFEHYFHPSLFVMERSLCMGWRDWGGERQTHIAIFKEGEGGNGSWIRLFHFRCEYSFGPTDYGSPNRYRMLGITPRGSYVVHFNKSSVILIDPNRKRPDDIRVLRIPKTGNVISYVRSLASPFLGEATKAVQLGTH